MALARAVLCTGTVRHVLLTAPQANLRGPLDRGVPTFAGAILDRAMYCVPGVKRLTTMSTNRGTAGVAYEGCARSWLERCATLPALAQRNTIGEHTVIHQPRVFLPERHISLGVATGTQRNEVGKTVGPSVIIEEMKWPDVMDRQALALETAVLAGVVIASSSPCALPRPVGSPIVLVPSHPHGVGWAGPFRTATPLPEAGTATEVSLTHLAVAPLKGLAASMAGNGCAITSESFAMDALPLAIARLTTEVVF